MSKKTLSIMPYYGGKARMAHFIAEHINYDDSDIFITPFGGAARVLLNKPPHKEEIYNDFNSGLCALMTILSSTKSATDFIERLYEIDCTEEKFNWAKKIYDFAEVDLEQQARKALRKLLIDKKVISSQKANLMLNKLAQYSFSTEKLKLHEAKFAEDTSLIEELETLSYASTNDPAFNIKYKNLLNNWKKLYRLKEIYGAIPPSRDIIMMNTDDSDLQDISDMTLAIATYIVFTHSRDGMGKVWSGAKFKDTEQYKKYVLKLFKCAERLQGVHIYHADAVEFFGKYKYMDEQDIDKIEPMFITINKWINNPRVMMCCDPSYIDPREEAKALEGIDINKEDSLSDAITRLERKYPGDLGEDVYTKSFDYKAHENFLRCIQKAKCKILVCNYDLALYNKYLNEDTGWKRSEFVTSTSIGGKKNNLRVEVVWYNY